MKPAVLETKHVEQYKTHMERGLSMFPPEQLNEMLASGKLAIDSNNALMNTLVCKTLNHCNSKCSGSFLPIKRLELDYRLLVPET